MMTKICDECCKIFEKPYSCSIYEWIHRRMFCSRKCSDTNKIGKKLPESTRLRMVGRMVWNKGISPSASTKQKISTSLCGRRLSEETKNKMKGRGSWNKGKLGEYNLPKRKPENELLTPINNRIRHSPKYKAWRKKIFERDDYTCVKCGQRGGKLNADHIKSFARFPELRFELSNGRTMCIPCHKQTDTYGWKSRTKRPFVL